MSGHETDPTRRDGDPAMDAMLAAHARRQPVPSGLSARVFEASVRLLPMRKPSRAQVFRLEPYRPGRQWWWGRLALAASVAMAFVIAIRVAQPPAAMSPELELALLEYAAAPGLELVIDFEDPGFTTVESMLVTRDMTFADLAGDLDTLAKDL